MLPYQRTSSSLKGLSVVQKAKWWVLPMNAAKMSFAILTKIALSKTATLNNLKQ